MWWYNDTNIFIWDMSSDKIILCPFHRCFIWQNSSSVKIMLGVVFEWKPIYCDIRTKLNLPFVRHFIFQGFWVHRPIIEYSLYIKLLSQDGFLLGSDREKVTGSALAHPPLVSEQTLREEVHTNHPKQHWSLRSNWWPFLTFFNNKKKIEHSLCLQKEGLLI